MGTYWTSKKSKKVIESRRVELDLLISFSNADMENPENQFLEKQVLDHLYRHPALHPDNRDWKNDGNLNSMVDALQKHLRSRLAEIVENAKMLWEMPLWKISGTIEFTFDPRAMRFQERFQLRKVKRGNEIKALKKILDLWLIEIIRDLDFSPQRFGQCPRCGNLFYSPTIKERIYCSKRCGGASRQEKFRKERKPMEK